MTATPRNPIATPASLAGVMRSSRVSRWASTTVNSGVVALRMAASPPVIAVCPQTIRLKGIRLLSAPMTKKARHLGNSRGSPSPTACAKTKSASAPTATRAKTTLSGGSASRATSAKKNDPPHNTERTISRAHSPGPMEVLMVAKAGLGCLFLPCALALPGCGTLKAARRAVSPFLVRLPAPPPHSGARLPRRSRWRVSSPAPPWQVAECLEFERNQGFALKRC